MIHINNLQSYPYINCIHVPSLATPPQAHRQPPMTETARKQAHDPMGAAARGGARSGIGPLTLEELKDLCR